MDKKLLLLDSSALAFRMFYAFSKTPLINSKQIDVSMLHGYWGAVLRILSKHKPTHFAIVQDVHTPTFRHELYPDYKANRGPMPEEMAAQLPLLQESLELSKIPLLSETGFEADDVMASVATAAEKAGFEKIFLITKDKDMAQIVSEKIHLFHLEKGADGIDLGPAEVLEKYGLPPSQIRDYLALMGDTSDNVPGVPKVGPKTAIQLLRQFGNIDNIYEHLSEISKKALRENLANSRENAFLSRELVTLQKTICFSGTLEELEFHGVAFHDLQNFFKENELSSLNTLLLKIPSTAGSPIEIPEENPRAIARDVLVDSKEKFSELEKEIYTKKFTLYIITDSENAMNASLIGISVSPEENAGYYIPLSHIDELNQPKGNAPFEEVKIFIRKILANPENKIIIHNAKFALHILLRVFEIENYSARILDSEILAWMLSPGEKNLSLEELARREFDFSLPEKNELVGYEKQKNSLARIAPEHILEYAAERASWNLKLWEALRKKAENLNYAKIFSELEMPLSRVLLEMETTGVFIDTRKLNSLANEIESSLFKMEQETYSLAGATFNIASTKQLAEILFDKLGFPMIKKRSTDSVVLEELEFQTGHPIISLLMEQREQRKLLSTYINALPTLVNPRTKRVHTTFLQWGTATGRLSSRDPNLQNIPIRSELGKKIRETFVPESKDSVILSADYSQIELRMLAHLSGDENLILAYKNGEDIHTQTASAIYNVPKEEVTADMRRSAKVVNFGILYGMTSFRLARDLKISRSKAKEFIDGYFSLYSGVQKFIDETTAFARQTGYVETLLGRRRYIPGIFSKDKMECKMAERMAVNTPVQGSAADLIKLAMISISKRIKAEALPMKMILQVHDELVFEAQKSDVDFLKQIVKEEMEKAIRLSVPLVASVGIGENWLAAH